MFPGFFLDFDQRVNDNKTAAEEALRRVPAINRTIAEAAEKTREAQLALGNAAADASEAKAKAHEAERIASAVQQVTPESSFQGALHLWDSASVPPKSLGLCILM